MGEFLWRFGRAGRAGCVVDSQRMSFLEVQNLTDNILGKYSIVIVHNLSPGRPGFMLPHGAEDSRCDG